MTPRHRAAWNGRHLETAQRIVTEAFEGSHPPALRGSYICTRARELPPEERPPLTLLYGTLRTEELKEREWLQQVTG